MPSPSSAPIGRLSRSFVSALAVVSIVAVSAFPASGQTSEGQGLEAGPATCVAMFTVMAYAYADDDLKEQQLEEKKALAKAAIQPKPAAVSAEAPLSEAQSAGTPPVETKSQEERIQNIMDVLTEMMLNQPAQAEVIARECFRQYPPAIELN